MKISELSRRSGLPVPTIKYYLREGLLAHGRRLGRNQADYDIQHLERLSLIRSLQQEAGLRVDQIARCLHAADRAKRDFVTTAIDAIGAPRVEADPSSPEYALAKRTVMGLVRRRGWRVKTTDGSVKHAIHALAVALRSVPMAEDEAQARGVGTKKSPTDYTEALEFYAEAVEPIVAREIPDTWRPDKDRDAALRYAVLGTLLFEPFILALRRMAHVSRSRELAR